MSSIQDNRWESGHRCPRISVCMAAYNGERYIQVQLASILEQLNSDDEIVIVDDCSSDRTCELISGMGDNRIRLIQHKKNAGAKKTFEDAIRNALGEILFLSDQDDIWPPGKVDKVCQAFDRNRDVQIVATSFKVIDNDGEFTYDSVYSNWPRFRPGLIANIWSNRVLGSTMAIRSSDVYKILPFPAKYWVEHDAWIMAVNSITGGKVAYLDEPLLFYRRHRQNLSTPLSWRLRIKKRVHLVAALIVYSLQVRKRGSMPLLGD
ncbi:MAG: glycosyltransferase [Acidobacteria bacterium]|nr:glycosyltransferase [Acidobacteriota bacterium]